MKVLLFVRFDDHVDKAIKLAKEIWGECDITIANSTGQAWYLINKIDFDGVLYEIYFNDCARNIFVNIPLTEARRSTSIFL